MGKKILWAESYYSTMYFYRTILAFPPCVCQILMNIAPVRMWPALVVCCWIPVLDLYCLCDNLWCEWTSPSSFAPPLHPRLPQLWFRCSFHCDIVVRQTYRALDDGSTVASLCHPWHSYCSNFVVYSHLYAVLSSSWCVSHSYTRSGLLLVPPYHGC